MSIHGGAIVVCLVASIYCAITGRWLAATFWMMGVIALAVWAQEKPPS